MKKIFFGFMAIFAISLAACNSGPKNESTENDMNRTTTDTIRHAHATDSDEDVKTVTVAYTKVDAKAAVSIKEIADHYLQMKNALVNDKGIEAASGAKEMERAIRKLDKSLLTAEQKASYDKHEGELKEHASNIATNGDKIKHQRSHFSMMSEVMYNLVKSFGAGRTLYHDHCPMFNENKGAMWLSEMKEVKNPYYGAEMLTCGSVEEIIK